MNRLFTLSLILILSSQLLLIAERSYFKQIYKEESSELNYSKLIVKVKNLNNFNNLNDFVLSEAHTISPYFNLNNNNSFSLSNQDNLQFSDELVELAKYFYIDLDGIDVNVAMDLANRINNISDVHIAYFEPKPVAPAANSPDLRNYQYYIKPSDIGVGYSQIKNFPGAKGDGIKYCDVEYSTILNHEDFDDSKLNVANPNGGFPYEFYYDHGAAVLGIANALENDYGIDGMIPNAKIYIAYPCYSSENCIYNVTQAIIDATEVLEFGDVMLLEQQTNVPYPQTYRLGPVEFYDATFDAIKLATAKGITVIEAGGNGGINLDTNFFEGIFDRKTRNSGAIMVAAASLESNYIMSFSPYGNRIDLFANGEKIASTGYGDAFNDPNNLRIRDYTYRFSGTSGASAIIAPTAVSLQGLFFALTGKKFNPQDLRDLLFITGIDSESPKHIGRMPDLSKAYQYILDNYSDVKEDNIIKKVEFTTIKSNTAIQITNWSPELINQSLEIYDFLGRKVIQYNSINFEIIDLDNLRIESGIYFIVSGNSRYKFVKL